MPTQPRPPELSGDLPTPQVEPVSEQPTGAEQPTGPERVPARRPRWPFFGAGVAVLLVGLLAGALWYGMGPAGPNRLALLAGGARSSARASSSSSARPGIGIGGCMLGAVGAACPSAPQCFDSLTVSSGVARARSLPCTRPHTWEVFAIGLLPGDVRAVGYPAVKSQQTVARVCNSATLTLIDMDARSWQVDVLPPSPEAFAGGDRSFRCLAGTGPNRQTTAAFAR
jgi:hypothetical protein